MKGIKLLIAIVPRGKGDNVAQLCRDNGLTFSMISPAYGAGGTHFMDYLGLSNLEKDCALSVVRSEFAQEMLARINDHFHLDEPDTGIVLTIPIAAVSGPRALRYISGIYSPAASAPEPHRKECSQMNETNTPDEFEKTREFDLIITVVNRGFSDLAIEASKAAGAKGATVLYAHGTGIHEVEKFFAISIQPEKELILTIVHHNTTKDVMHAIIDAAGLQTEGRGLCFSLPVDEVAGIARWANHDKGESQ